MTDMVVTRTDPDSGKDIPACALCGWIVSRIPRGKATDKEFSEMGRRFTQHVIDQHPDKAIELSQKGKRKV